MALSAAPEREKSNVRGENAASLFVDSEVRVSDLVGDLTRPTRVDVPLVVVTPPLRSRRLSLDWYDYGVVALVVASVISGVICLLRGV